MPGRPRLLDQAGRAFSKDLWLSSSCDSRCRSCTCERSDDRDSRADDQVSGGVSRKRCRRCCCDGFHLYSLSLCAVQRDERRFETIRELNQVGHKECVDRCIRSSFCHLDEPLRLAFMALGFFRGSFEVEAAEAVLSSPFSGIKESPRSLTASSASTSTSYFPGYAYASGRQRSRDDDVSSIQSLGSQLSNMDEFSFENDGAMTNDSYDLLDLESTEEIKARAVKGAFSAGVS